MHLLYNHLESFFLSMSLLMYFILEFDETNLEEGLLNGADLSNELLRTVFHQNHKRVCQRNQERRGKKREPPRYLTRQPLFSTTLHFWKKKGGRRTTPSLSRSVLEALFVHYGIISTTGGFASSV